MLRWIDVGVVIAVALLLRIPRLGASELWFDEAYSGLLTFSDPRELLGWVRAEVTPPLYYLLLRAWAFLFGHGEAALRILSVCAGVLTPALVCLIAQRASRSAGLAAGLVVALSPIHVYYSQEARMYALLLLFLCAALGCFLRAMDEEAKGEIRWWVGYALFAACAVWTHYFALFVLAGVPLLALEGGRRAVRGALLANLAAGLLCLPLLPWVFTQLQLPATGWIDRAYHAIPPSLAIPRTLEILTPGALYPDYYQFRFGPPLWRPAVFVLLCVTLIPGLLTTVRGRGGGAPRLARAGAIFLAMPLVLMVIISLFRPVYLLARYDLIALPGFALLAGVGVAAWMRPVRLVIAGLALVLTVGSLAPHYEKASDYNSLSRAVTAELAPALQHNDVVIYTGFTLPVVRYPLLLRGMEHVYRTVPESSARHPGWVDTRALASKDTHRAETVRVVRDASEAAREMGGRVWVIADPRVPGAQETVDMVSASGLRAVQRVPLPSGPPGSWRLTLSAFAFESPYDSPSTMVDPSKALP
jgi:4-amino-4-deoxy-L-arabinose transferase-like glycosyltransferase